MNVREHLLCLTDELRRLKGEGSRTVVVNEESLAELRRAVEVARAELAASSPVAAVAAAPLESDAPSSPTQAAVAEPTNNFTAAAFAPPRAPRVVPASPPASSLGAPPPLNLPSGSKQERWNALREIVLNDATCKARVYPGKQVVFGVGSLDAAVMFIGEAPGADEEEQGEPFVGRAGQLLNRMIKAMGLERSQVYIGNILNWRPEMGTRSADGFQTGNRPPTLDEMAYCLPFIRAQIDIIQPRVLVALGKTAVDGLLGADRFKTMGAARGSWHAYNGIPLRATYHPSYLLRQEGLRSEAALKIKRDAWEDLLAVMEKAELPISEKQRGYFKTA
ncbi:MAG TPA: uracil-DNA glycosylase [Acidobacteriota bacterium]|nr:uracil-DNA glycosylase [Acidobacteriota bacterium]